MARLKDKVQNALDEARMLILGCQVLLGFQYRTAFEEGFDRLSRSAKYMDLACLFLLLVVLALLISPGAYHRLVTEGEDTDGVHRFTSTVMDLALLPFATVLAIDIFIVTEKTAGRLIGIIIASITLLVTVGFWYGFEAIQRLKRSGRRRTVKSGNQEKPRTQTKLRDKIKHVLTEARVVLPGAQALLGFQFVTVLMGSFDKLPIGSKYVHLASLCMNALTVVFLMTPAAYHRIVEEGEESESFHRLASWFLLFAMVTLPLGVCGDLFVVVRMVSESARLAAGLSAVTLLFFYGVWFGLPIFLRNQPSRE
jgi:uncharacterized protein DUF6328